MFQGAVGFAAMFPVIVVASGLDEQIPAVAGGVLVSGIVTRIMANPQVNDWINQFMPWLAAEPKELDDVDANQ